MTDDPPSSTSSLQRLSWLERLGQALLAEPRDREELVEILRDAENRALLDARSLAMIEGVLQVSEMRVRDIMIPRSQMVVVDRDDPNPTILSLVIESAHSRFPVIGENQDEVVGILLAKDLLPYGFQDEENFHVRELLRPAVFVPESKRLDVLLGDFRASRNHLAVVVDEYGGVAGMVTIEDVLEQIVGEIEDEHDIEEETAIMPYGNGEYGLKALTTIEDFNLYFDSDFSDQEYDTVGGLVLHHFGRVPGRGEWVEVSCYRFEVVRSDSRRVYLLKMRKLSAQELGAESGG